MFMKLRKIFIGTCLILPLILLLAMVKIHKLKDPVIKEDHNRLVKNDDQILLRKDSFTSPRGNELESESLTLFNVHNFDTKKTEEVSSCRPPVPTKASKELAKKLFFSEPPAGCNLKKPWEICFIWVAEVEKMKVRCYSGICNVVSVGIISQATGLLEWTTFTSTYLLEDYIYNLAHQDLPNHAFCMLTCGYMNVTKNANQDLYQKEMQLLILPPQFDLTPPSSPHHSHSKLNHFSVNLIHIDALSRDHFLRSMPQTVNVLNDLKKTSNSEVLDYELLQTLKARTFESLRLLITGQVPGDIDLMTNPFDRDMIPVNASVDFEYLFSAMKRHGRRTLYIDDLCWRYHWGLAKHLGIWTTNLSPTQTWKLFQEMLKTNQIDDIGPSVSSCNILEGHNLEDPFQGPDALCFNGYHQHKYLLDYLLMFQGGVNAMHESFFTFFMSNIAHEPSGRRVQTFDSEFAEYLVSVSQMPNVLTVIVSDHGNSYGEFVESSFQGRLEVFNPLFFLIIPRNIVRIFGKDWLRSLKENQESLITHLDIHLFLISLTENGPKTKEKAKQMRHEAVNESLHVSDRTDIIDKDVSFKVNMEKAKSSFVSGLNPLASNSLEHRTCDDIPLLVDTICLCEGFFTHAIPQPRYFLLAMFAVGEINKMIGHERVTFQETLPAAPPPPAADQQTSGCLPLALYDVTDAWIRHENDTSIVQINVLVKVDTSLMDKLDNAYGLLESIEELFTVTVLWRVNGSPGLTLSSVRRLSPYGQYKTCTDPGVDPMYCICSKKPVKRLSNEGKAVSNEEKRAVKMSDKSEHNANENHVPFATNVSMGEPAKSLNVSEGVIGSGGRGPSASSLIAHSLKDLPVNTSGTKWNPDKSHPYWIPRDMLGWREVHVVSGSLCLRLSVLRSTMGAVFWMKNLCHAEIKFNFRLIVSNMDVSIDSPLIETIRGGSVSFLATCVQSSPNRGWKWKYVTYQIH